MYERRRCALFLLVDDDDNDNTYSMYSICAKRMKTPELVVITELAILRLEKREPRSFQFSRLAISIFIVQYL
jgi:hypothetical protein